MTCAPPSPFSDPGLVARYAGDTPKRVPGFADLHRMAQILLAEQAGEAAHLLVVGAGGGLELAAFAAARPNWRFTGVDPSQPMLDLAQQVSQPFEDRIALICGSAGDAPPGPFDGASCFLVLHFLTRAGRLALLREIRARLRPGAALVVAHHTAPGEAAPWLTRSLAFAAGSAGDPAQLAETARMMETALTLLSPEEEEAMLREAGFHAPALFYAGLSFRGWVATVG